MSLEDRHYFNKIRKNMNASIDAGKKKKPWKNSTHVQGFKKTLSHQTTNRKELPQFDKGHLWKPCN